MSTRLSTRISACFVCVAMFGCHRAGQVTRNSDGAIDAAIDGAPSTAPDASLDGQAELIPPEPELGPPTVTKRACPKEMVLVLDRYCVDRFEGVLVRAPRGDRLSPFYPPDPEVLPKIFHLWQRHVDGNGGPMQTPTQATTDSRMALPRPPEFELLHEFMPREVSRRGVLPQGYTSGVVAERSCRAAGKRLCTLQEWTRACRGEEDRKFPYGDVYRPGACNVARATHPAKILHGDASRGHSDPRLNLVSGDDGPLLRATGSTSTCGSRWNGDAIYDLVGNIDEWIDDPSGTFVGGFYSRGTHEGCDARITVHPYDYWDYSTGIRCCRDAAY